MGNTRDAPTLLATTYSNPSLLPANRGQRGESASSTALPMTPGNTQNAQHFSTPSSKDRSRTTGEASHVHRNQHLSTPKGKDRSRSSGEVDEMHATDTPATGLYQSGKENSISGMSATTTNTSILGRETSGMAAALERRRHARVDHRVTAED